MERLCVGVAEIKGHGQVTSSLIITFNIGLNDNDLP